MVKCFPTLKSWEVLFWRGSKNHELVFTVEEDVAWARFSATFIGVVGNVRSSYNMQEILDKEDILPLNSFLWEQTYAYWKIGKEEQWRNC